MPGNNGLNGWGWVKAAVVGILSTVGAGLIMAAGAVIANDPDDEQQRRIEKIEAEGEKRDAEIREHHDAIIKTEAHLENIDDAIVRVMQAVETIAEKVE